LLTENDGKQEAKKDEDEREAEQHESFDVPVVRNWGPSNELRTNCPAIETA
jgi:hypothetical protein